MLRKGRAIWAESSLRPHHCPRTARPLLAMSAQEAKEYLAKFEEVETAVNDGERDLAAAGASELLRRAATTHTKRKVCKLLSSFPADLLEVRKRAVWLRVARRDSCVFPLLAISHRLLQEESDSKESCVRELSCDV